MVDLLVVISISFPGSAKKKSVLIKKISVCLREPLFVQFSAIQTTSFYTVRLRENSKIVYGYSISGWKLSKNTKIASLLSIVLISPFILQLSGAALCWNILGIKFFIYKNTRQCEFLKKIVSSLSFPLLTGILFLKKILSPNIVELSFMIIPVKGAFALGKKS